MSARSISLRGSILALLSGLAAACGGGQGRPEVPLSVTAQDLSDRTVAAFRAEASDDKDAVKRYLELLDEAQKGDSAWHLAAARAAVDALVARSVTSLRMVSPRSALAFRAPRPAKGSDAPESTIEKEFTALYKRTDSAVVKGELARGLMLLAERRGDAAGAETYRAARGCARQITITPPLDWTSLTALSAPSSLDAFDAPVPALVSSPGPFGHQGAPLLVADRGCDIDLMAATAETGVREVIVDLEVTRKETIALELRARSAAHMRIGGLVAMNRPYELGDALVSRMMTRVEVESGRVRVVVRVAGEEHGSTIGISAWHDDGKPIATFAPKVGERATARALRVVPLAGAPTAPPSHNYRSAERLTLALGALASGDPRSAESLLAKISGTSPELGLAYARSLEGAVDLPQVQRDERARSAVQKVLDAAPSWWEPSLMSAQLAAARRGEGEALIEALNELQLRRAKGAKSPMLDAFEAAYASNAELHDRARAAASRFSAAEDGAPLSAEVEEFATRAPSVVRVKTACSDKSPLDRNALDCYGLLRELGRHDEAKRELGRLRQLAGAPRLYGPMAVRDGIAAGDLADARIEFDRSLPGERSVAAAFALAPNASFAETRQRMVSTLLAAREAPIALSSVLTAVGDDRLRPFEGVAERVVAEDRAHPAMRDAATVVLTHTERYSIEPSGLVHVLVHDVRRVGGTTDVEENAQADAPMVVGRTSLRALVRRILKTDGRILLPDTTPGAAQSHADLSQLGPGDAVEAIYEGFAIPSETYDVGFDTPDLLPDRTAVVSASIEIRVPKALRVSMHAHPMLGEAASRDDGAMKVLSWSLKDKAARRFEEGVPKMDRSVGISLTTSNWEKVARGLDETIRSLDEHDPELAAWALAAAGGAKPSLELLSRVVTAAGESLRQPGGAIFADFGVGRAGARQTQTARTFLAEREGSRTWLVARALRELGIPYEIVVAEQQPYSTDPEFPARFGRFVHPLLIARVPDEKGQLAERFIDADVPGPPLPPGRFSAELRGRKILHTDGRITALPSASGGEPDELDLRLTLDDKGDARGSFTAILRGRAAQELADAFTHIVGDERQSALRSVVLGYVPSANVDAVVLSSSEGSWQIALRADITVGGYAQPEKNKKGEVTWVIPGVDAVHYVFPRPYSTSVAATYAAQGARQNALAVAQALQYHFRRRIDLPKGTRVIRSPGPLRYEGPLLHAERAVIGGASALEDDFVLNVTTGTVARDGYAAFVDGARRIDESFLASARVAFPQP